MLSSTMEQVKLVTATQQRSAILLFKLNQRPAHHIVGASIGSFGFSDVYGLAAAENGVFYGTSGARIFSVDTATGASTIVTDFSGQCLGQVDGASFLSEAVPSLSNNRPGILTESLAHKNGQMRFAVTGEPGGTVRSTQ